MKPISIFLLICFMAVIIIDTLLGKLSNPPNQYLIKGLLIPLLLGAFIFEVKDDGSKFTSIRLVLLALIFCFIADLVWIDFKPRVNFAIGALCYSIGLGFFGFFFYKQRPFRQKDATLLFVLTILLLATITVLMYMMWSRISLQNMTYPVAIFLVALSGMLLCAVNVTNSRRLNKTAVVFFIPGALGVFVCFLMILLNRFYGPNSLFSTLSLLLYGAGLFLILRGATLLVTNKRLS